MARPMEILGAGRTMFAFGVWNSTFPDPLQYGSGWWCNSVDGQPGWEVWHGNVQSDGYLQDGEIPVKQCMQNDVIQPDVQAEVTGKGFCITPGGAGFFFYFDETGALIANYPDDQSVQAAAMSPITDAFPTVITGFGNSIYGMRDCRGFVASYFDTFPADYLEAASWMASAWSSGHQFLYPGWRGRT